jgi:hypothetical protein
MNAVGALLWLVPLGAAAVNAFLGPRWKGRVPGLIATGGAFA